MSTPTREEMEAVRVRVTALADRMILSVGHEPADYVVTAAIETALRLIKGGMGVGDIAAMDELMSIVGVMKLATEHDMYIPPPEKDPS